MKMEHSSADSFTKQHEDKEVTRLGSGSSKALWQKSRVWDPLHSCRGSFHRIQLPESPKKLRPAQLFCWLLFSHLSANWRQYKQQTTHLMSLTRDSSNRTTLPRLQWLTQHKQCSTMVCYTLHTILRSVWPIYCRELKMCNWIGSSKTQNLSPLLSSG